MVKPSTVDVLAKRKETHAVQLKLHEDEVLSGYTRQHISPLLIISWILHVPVFLKKKKNPWIPVSDSLWLEKVASYFALYVFYFLNKLNVKLLKPASGNFLGSFSTISFRFQCIEFPILSFVSLFLQLAYCIVQFLEKDPSLTEPVSIFSIISNVQKDHSSWHVEKELIAVCFLLFILGYQGVNEVLAQNMQSKRGECSVSASMCLRQH